MLWVQSTVHEFRTASAAPQFSWWEAGLLQQVFDSVQSESFFPMFPIYPGNLFLGNKREVYPGKMFPRIRLYATISRAAHMCGVGCASHLEESSIQDTACVCTCTSVSLTWLVSTPLISTLAVTDESEKIACGFSQGVWSPLLATGCWTSYCFFPYIGYHGNIFL